MDFIRVDFKKTASFILGILIIVGVFMRFHRIAENQFFFYDEGLWLNAGRPFVELIQRNPAKDLGEFFKILQVSGSFALSSAKSLWLFISNLRGFFFSNPQDWYFTRLVSAFFGVLSIGMTYLLARRYYQSKNVALLSAAILALLPSHMFYSRLALQESLSLFCFLVGVYFYLSSRGMNGRTFVSSFFLSLVFLSNYRMIIIPVIMGFCELFISFSDKKKFDIRKYVYNTVTFLAIIFLLGSLDKGKNTYITFAWMFHQSHLAQGHFSWVNLFSYPYYLFKLESVFFGLFFFANLYFLWKKKWAYLLPFALSLFLMVLFSFPQEKGVRYLCVVFPFMAMAVAYMIDVLYQGKKVFYKPLIAALVVIMFGQHLLKSREIILFKTDYATSIQDVLNKDPKAKFLSTQEMIQKLFVLNSKDVIEASNNFGVLLKSYQDGYRYFILDPQAYVSLTEDKLRFSSQLAGPIEFIFKNMPPYKTYPHFSSFLLERFVLEHNEHLMRSIEFLRDSSKRGSAALYVYDLNVIIPIMQRLIQMKEKK
ncbi:MAG TPA: phospholipid carrier-dependent glycosyltransferase [Candidatus Omnitrophota bacterium]|nr:phospholipid carrier-dependent glycosyltransferase [Candidatus Omnitrophota bacterium]